MLPVRTPPVKYDVFRLQGGLDQVTPTLSLPPGVAREAMNFECSVTGGYTRIAGYERFDGRPSPNAATWTFITLSSVTGLSVGATIRNLANTVTGVVIALSGNVVIYTKAVGAFSVGNTVYVGATPIGDVTNNTSFFVDSLNSATYSALASDVYRNDIQVVPGEGPIRGVAYLNNTVYAWRNNVGSTAMVIHRSTASGWQAVSLGLEISFTGTGATAVAEGDTISNNAGTATGVVTRVVRETGSTWATSTGRLILSSVTGTWASGDHIRVGGSHLADATSGATAITLAPNGNVETVVANFGGAGATSRLYGADKVNRGFEFDGSIYVPIKTGMADDTPDHVIAHKNYLFFSFGPSVQNSNVGAPYAWSPITGTNEMLLSEPVTAFVSLPGDESTGSLAMYTQNTTSILYGTISSQWNLVPFDVSTGAYQYTVQPLVDTYCLDQRGVVSLATTRAFGNFDSATLTFTLRPFVQARRGLATASSTNREKSQYRVFYSDGYALYVTVTNGKLLGSMPIYFPNPVACCATGEMSTGAEVAFYGSTNGYVYQMDVGPSFDSQPVMSYLKLNFNAEGASRVLKRYRRASLEVSGTGYATFDFGYSLAYDTTDIDQAGTTPYSVPFLNGSWDSFVWDTFYWDSRGLAPVETVCDGTGENIALAVASNTRLSQPFTINSATLHYSFRRGIR